MASNPVWEICERMAEAQAMLHDYLEAGKQTTAADVIAKAQAVLTESELLRAMFDVGYFPPNARSFSFVVSRSAIIAPCHPRAASRRPGRSRNVRNPSS